MTRTDSPVADLPPVAGFAQTESQNAYAHAALEAERANRLQREMAMLAGKPTDHGMVIVLQDALFDDGQSLLKTEAQPRLDQLAALLNRHPERRVLVEGFTDNGRSADSNRGLSRARAESVRAALLTRGIDGSRIECRGSRDAHPIAANDSASGRLQNRRVEIRLSDGEGRFAVND
jgi:outer membrane protein OmpA-like peptidoglycan-associated protein